MTVNALLPGGAPLTGMISEDVAETPRSRLLDPAVMISPLLWLTSVASDGVTGQGVNASLWRTDLNESAASALVTENAGVC